MGDGNYWLMKSEPHVYSIDDLEKDGSTHWDGVRNYQARNFMRDQMQVGDTVLYYHSNTKVPGIVGLARVCKSSYPDFTAHDPTSKYHDPKSSPEKPRWFMVDIEYRSTFSEVLSLATLKASPELDGMLVIKKGMRLSVQPVEEHHFRAVLKLANADQASQ